MDVIVGVMRGMGYGIMPMIVSIFGSCALRVVWVYTVFQVHRTLTVLYMSWPVTWIITFTIHLLCYGGIWMLHHKEYREREQFEPSA